MHWSMVGVVRGYPVLELLELVYFEIYMMGSYYCIVHNANLRMGK